MCRASTGFCWTVTAYTAVLSSAEMAQGFAGPAWLLPDALRVATGKVNVLEPSCTDPPSFPCGAGGVAESPNLRHSTANMPHHPILLDKLM